MLGFADTGPHCVGIESQSSPNSPAEKGTSSGQSAKRSRSGNGCRLRGGKEETGFFRDRIT